jgi:AraC-like DNA-binding protein
MPDQATVPAHYVRVMTAIANEHQCDTEALLSRIGIDQALIDTDQPISALLYGELHHQIIEMVEDEWFGMLSGGAVPKGSTRLLCQTVVHCKTLDKALQRSNEFFEICRGFKIKQAYQCEGDQAIVQITKLDHITQAEFDQLMATTPRPVIKSTLSVWHGFFSWMIGQSIPLVAFNYACQQSNEDSTTQDNVSIRYDQNCYGITFDKKYLDYPIVQNEDNVEDFLRKAPYYVFQRLLKSDDSLAHRVKVILAKSIGDEFPNAPEVAHILNLSITTLHRHLSQEGSSFQKLKDESRMEAAIHYLNCPDINTTAIAELVGFENPSTFFRSFKKWTGLPPGEYRKRLAQKTAN